MFSDTGSLTYLVHAKACMGNCLFIVTIAPVLSFTTVKHLS